MALLSNYVLSLLTLKLKHERERENCNKKYNFIFVLKRMSKISKLHVKKKKHDSAVWELCYLLIKAKAVMRHSHTPLLSYRRSCKSQDKISHILPWCHVPKCLRQVWSGHNCRQKSVNVKRRKSVTKFLLILFDCLQTPALKIEKCTYMCLPHPHPLPNMTGNSCFLREQSSLFRSNWQLPIFVDRSEPQKGALLSCSSFYPRFRPWHVQRIGEWIKRPNSVECIHQIFEA